MKAVSIGRLLSIALILLISASIVTAVDKGRIITPPRAKSISAPQTTTVLSSGEVQAVDPGNPKALQPHYSIGNLQLIRIYRQVISGGGGKGASQDFRLNCSVAQTAAGEGTSDSYELCHGFWPPFGGTCCNLPGDANDDGQVNVGDAVFLINYVFKGGPPPPCLNEGDANGDCGVNVGDAVYLISYIFKGGPAPVCGCAG